MTDFSPLSTRMYNATKLVAITFKFKNEYSTCNFKMEKVWAFSAPW